MSTIDGYPPNIDAIREVFPITDSVIFAYWPDVYVPSGRPLTPALEAHEQVHLQQQDGDPEAWWEKYLADPQFRYEQELAAHRTEYRVACSITQDREQRLRYLREIGKRLGGPLYGSQVTTRRAMCDIKGGNCNV